MGELGEVFNDWKANKRAIRAEHGVKCPRCAEVRPRAHPTILLPGQVCKVDGYKDMRPRLTQRQLNDAARKHNAPILERVK
jgi:hypothetical protein